MSLGRTARAVALAAALAGCAGPQPQPLGVARLPPNAFGTYADGDIGAINIAAWAFADPARTRDDPADAALASAAVEYLAGQLDYGPRWAFMSPLVKMEMVQARAEVRSTLGIRPDAPSQDVVDQLLYAAEALTAGSTPGALSALGPPAFTLPPEVTLARLARMPFLRTANIASMHAAGQSQPVTGGAMER